MLKAWAIFFVDGWLWREAQLKFSSLATILWRHKIKNHLSKKKPTERLFMKTTMSQYWLFDQSIETRSNFGSCLIAISVVTHSVLINLCEWVSNTQWCWFLYELLLSDCLTALVTLSTEQPAYARIACFYNYTYYYKEKHSNSCSS